jgi:hypothetical protein
MTTASTLVAAVQAELGDAAGTQYDSTTVYGWLNEAQRMFVQDLMPLRAIAGYAVSQYQDSVAYPSDCIMVENVVSRRGPRLNVARKKPEQFRSAQTAVPQAIAVDPYMWTEMDGRIYLYPRYAGAGLTTTVNASTAAGDTSITLASTGNLRSNGRVDIEGEEVEYAYKTTTAITGCRRGVGGTTAASHASAASVTQKDLEILYRRTPVALTSTASPEISPIHHDTLKVYAKYLAYMKEGSFDKAQVAFQLWQKSLQEARYQAKREYIGSMRITDTL